MAGRNTACLTTALYLAHLNPVTNAHVEIINELRGMADTVHVMPVVFVKCDREINSRSFPFGFETRKRMLRSVFGDTVEVSRNYTFYSPFSRYVPPLLSPSSWRLRRHILDGISGDYFTYTGDRVEGFMLRLYRLRPRTGSRKAISAALVKNRMYEEAAGGKADWMQYVPPGVASVIRESWETVRTFSGMEDRTVRVAGMKFPREGWSG